MRKPRCVALMFSATMMVLSSGIVWSQGYPNKPIRIITSGLGGGNDIVARLIAEGVSPFLGQPMIVENRGSGVLPGEIVSKAPPDGYTMLVAGGSFAFGHLLTKNTPYDPEKDFSPVTVAVFSPNVLVVHPSLPVRSVKELIALAKSRSGELNYSAGGVGGQSHLSAELFNAMAGVNIVRVTYKGTGQEITDLINGQVQLSFIVVASVMPHVKSGKLRALAVTSLQPTALAPDLPTVAASGLPGFDMALRSSVFAPPKTPPVIVSRLNQEIVRFLKTPEARQKFFNAGVEAVGSTPEELAATMKSEIARVGKVVKDAGIRAE